MSLRLRVPKLRLRSEVETHGEGFATVAEFTVSEGPACPVRLAWIYESHLPAAQSIRRRARSHGNVVDQMVRAVLHAGPDREAVLRSLITLKR